MMLQFIFFVIIVCGVSVLSINAVTVETFGLVPNVNTFEVAQQNSAGLIKALSFANSSDTDRIVEFPAGETYYLYRQTVEYLHDVTMRVQGTIVINDEIKKWNKTEADGIFQFNRAKFVTIDGNGTIDGQGLKWWRECYLGIDERYKLVVFSESMNIEVYHITLLNSPKFHLQCGDCANVWIDGVTIYVDSELQRGLINKRDSVTYALNTDGIDLSAVNATVQNCNITNWDDAIVAKPCHEGKLFCQCSSDMFIYNNDITYSVGLTIGSVPPNTDHNCVRNVHFLDNRMFRPTKAMYIKSNPGDAGDAIIENIKYENLFVSQTLWWLLWIGPQQQNQPGPNAKGTGCTFAFPFVPHCPTNPRVTIRNISLVNIHAIDTLPLFEGPGVLLCNESNPCTDIHMENINVTFFDGDPQLVYDQIPIPLPEIIYPTRFRSDDVSLDYIVNWVTGSTAGYVNPEPCFEEKCYWDGESKW